jgi:hypothetical protein
MNRGGWEGLNMSTIWLGMLLGLPLHEVADWSCIYSHKPNCSRWRSLLAMGAPDSPVRHRTVSGAPPRHPSVRAWSWSTVGGFVLMWHRTARCHTRQSGAPLTCCSDIWISLFTLQSRPLHADSRCSAGAPDSPVAHRTVWWIIAELRLENPKLRSLSWFTLVHQTLSGGTPDSPVRQTRAHFGFLFAPFFWSLTCSFYWFVLNFWHL